MTDLRLHSTALFTVTASLLICCASAAPTPEADEPDAAHVENELTRACAGQCAMDYTACFQFSDGDACGCYPSYVSCMKYKCQSKPAFTPPTCDDAGPADNGAPDSASPDSTSPDTADPCPVECHCPDNPGAPPAPARTNTCLECEAACKVPG